MIGRVLSRGKRAYRLLCYPYSPGKSCLHSNPHLVSGWHHPAELEPPVREDGKRKFRKLTTLLEQPLAGLGDRAPRAEQEKATCGVTLPQQQPGARRRRNSSPGRSSSRHRRPCTPGMTRGYLPAVVSPGAQWCTFESFVVDVLASPRSGKPGVIENIAAAWFAERDITSALLIEHTASGGRIPTLIWTAWPIKYVMTWTS
jgi:hypothetical protein